MDAETMRELKIIKDQMNDLIRRVDNNLSALHNDNSDAIDDLTITILGEEAEANV